MSKSIKDALKKSVTLETEVINSKLKSFDDKSSRFKNAELFFKNNKEKPKQFDVVKKDIFSFPLDDYKLIELSINKAISLEKIMNKSEIIRAGLKSLYALTDKDFLDVINSVKKIKRGRK